VAHELYRKPKEEDSSPRQPWQKLKNNQSKKGVWLKLSARLCVQTPAPLKKQKEKRAPLLGTLLTLAALLFATFLSQ
jgi:hypothetical protein